MARNLTLPVIAEQGKRLAGRVTVLEGKIASLRRIARETAEARLDDIASDMAQMRTDIQALKADIQVLVDNQTGTT